MKEISVLTGLTLLIGLVFYFITELSPGNSEQPKEFATSLPSSVQEKEIFMNYSSRKSCSSDQALFEFAELDTNKSTLQPEKYITDAFSNPEKVIAAQKEDPSASIALFNMAASCFPEVTGNKQRPANCPDIKSKLNMKYHAIELLEDAARKGNLEAQLTYLLNAPIVISKFSRENQIELSFARYVKLNAEKFGENAARAGDSRALSVMSLAYEHGIFGVPDLEKSFMYSLPLAKNSLHKERARSVRLGERLTVQQRRSAEQLAWGCASQGDKDNLSNPF